MSLVAPRSLDPRDDLLRQRYETARVGPRKYGLVIVVGLLALLIQLKKPIGDRSGVDIDMDRSAAWRKQRGDMPRGLAGTRSLQLTNPPSNSLDVAVNDPPANTSEELRI